jgi:hypothetical protein
MAVGGLLLKGTAVFLRALQFLASLAVLGIFAYYLVYIRDHGYPTYTWIRAVTGIAGASALYTLIALFLVCCLGGKMFFAFLGIVLDVCFVGGWIAVAVLNRSGGTNSCGTFRRAGDRVGNYFGASGTGGRNDSTSDELHRICILQKASFGIAIAAIVLFLISAVWNLALGKHHQREKRNSVPNTPVVAHRKRRFWQRREKHSAGLPDPEASGVIRPSYDTAMTGATATDGTQYGYANTGGYGGQNKYANGTGY